MQLRFRHLMLAAATALALAAAPQLDPAQVLLEAAKKKEVVDGDVKAAIKQYGDIADKYGKSNRAVAATALVRMAEGYSKLGDNESRKVYERVVRDYADQKETAAIARARLTSRSSSDADGLVARRVWTNRFADGSPSPDGRYLTWTNSRAGGHLAIHDFVSGEDRDLTHGPEGSSPGLSVFTPDSKRILYQWYDSVEDDWSVRFIDVDGSNPRVVARNVGAPASVAPDGRTAVVTLQEGGSQQIALLDLTSGETNVLKSVEWRVPEIGNFSPDGRYIVYTLLSEQGSQDRDVYVLSVDGSSEFKVVAAPGANRGAYFSPDGSNIVFTSNRSGRWDLWTAPVAGGKPHGPPTLLKADIGPVTNLGFSRDGRLFFREQVDRSDAYVADFDTKTGIVRGTPRRISDRFIGSSAAPTWSVDGKKLAYVVDRVQLGIYQPADVTYIVANEDGTQQREFHATFSVGEFSRFLRWFPDSSALLLAQWSRRNREFRRLDLQTGKIQTLFTAVSSNNLNTVISPDGAAVYYAASDSGDRRIKKLMRRSLAAGEETSMYETRGGSGPAALHGLSASPDQKQIAYFVARYEGPKFLGWSIWMAPLGGGSPRQLQHPMDKHIIPNRSAWTMDGRGLLIVAGSENNYFADPQEMWYVPTDGSEPRKTGISMPILNSPSVHPDGDRIGFTGTTSTAHVWVMENILTTLRGNK